ncbi:MAG: alpha/beta family hydrolase, partial [Dermatophilaceae bacterium]
MTRAPGVRERLVDTPHGPARVTSTSPDDALGRLVLGHGAGGLRWTPDVLAVRDAVVGAGWAVDLVDQPWRVAGKRVGPRPAALDEAWLAVLATVPRHDIRSPEIQLPGIR